MASVLFCFGCCSAWSIPEPWKYSSGQKEADSAYDSTVSHFEETFLEPEGLWTSVRLLVDEQDEKNRILQQAWGGCGGQRGSREGAWVAGRGLRWETTPFLQGGLLDSPVIASSSPGFAFPVPSEGARVSAEGGSWTWPKALACLRDPAAGTCLLHSPRPGALHARGCLLSRAERWHEAGAVLTLLSCFDAWWWDLARVSWGGGGKDTLAHHRIPLHELVLEGSRPPTGRDFSMQEII